MLSGNIGKIDWITVTSSAIARSVVRLFGDDLKRSRLAAISPLTAEVLSDGQLLMTDLGRPSRSSISTAADPVMLEIFNNQFAGIAEQIDEHAGRQRGGQNVDDVIADQDAADQTLLALAQAVDQFGAPIAVMFELVHARPRGAWPAYPCRRPAGPTE